MVLHYATPDNAELVDTLENYYKPYRYSTLYSLHLPGLLTGDVLLIQCQFQTTIDTGVVMLAHAMLLHSAETIVRHVAKRPVGDLLCRYAGENITLDMRHGFRSLTGSARVTRSGAAWVSVIAYAATDGAPLGTKLAKVERNYGGMRAMVFRS